MDSESPARKARPRLNLYTKALRRERIFDRVRLGASIGDIASEEGLSPQRVRKIVSDTLKRHQIDDLPDHALLQLFRLESAQALATQAIEAGDLKAIPPFLKILDHIDLYRKASIRKVIYDNEARERLFAKINRVAARMESRSRKKAADAPGAAAEPAKEPESEPTP